MQLRWVAMVAPGPCWAALRLACPWSSYRSLRISRTTPAQWRVQAPEWLFSGLKLHRCALQFNAC